LISLVYPVRLYACSGECKWTGLLPSLSRLERRKRQVRLLLLFVLLAIGAGIAIRKYGAGLSWAHKSPQEGDGIEEVGGAAAE
jgi:hypothetical protein